MQQKGDDVFLTEEGLNTFGKNALLSDNFRATHPELSKYLPNDLVIMDGKVYTLNDHRLLNSNTFRTYVDLNRNHRYDEANQLLRTY